jgi:glutamate racemase
MIGIFDSGLGGLTAVKEVRALLPDADIVYFGDTGRVPYGTRSQETINKYARQDVEFLLSHGVDTVLAACGTVSSVALDSIKPEFNIPMLGVVNAAAEKAAKVSKSGIIGVIGTAATVNSHCFENRIKLIRPDAQVTSVACPLFVALVENGFISEDNQVIRLVADQYLAPMIEAGIDTLILGCTHFPIIEPVISACLEGVSMVNASKEAAIQLASMQKDSSGSGKTEYYVSDDPQNFDAIASLFLGCKDERIRAQKIDIEKY